MRTNRQKHELPQSDELEKEIEKFVTTEEKAFETEYKSGFDVIIGNPAYVQITFDKEYFSNKYQTSKAGDLYALFYERGLSILKSNGFFSYITPSLFIKGVRYESLRNYLLDNCKILELLDKGDGVFSDVQMPTAILTAQKIIDNKQEWVNFIPNGKLISKITNNVVKLSEISIIKRGLEIGKNKISLEENGIKILTVEDITRYAILTRKYISINIYNEFKKEAKFFNSERIVIRETGNRITALYVNEAIEQNRSLYSILLTEMNYQFILSIINSKLLQFFYKNKFAANTNIFPKIRIIQVKQLPIKEATEEQQQPFIEKAETMLSLNESLNKQKNQFLKLLQSNFEIKKLSKKLQTFYDYDFKTFVSELKKKKESFNLAQQAEWMEFFEQSKEAINQLQNQISTTDAQIDAMVYQLYGLTNEEIQIVEGAV